MSKIGKGVPPPATLNNIIKDLFENEYIKNQSNTSFDVLFSRAHLTDQQKQCLVYPNGLTPLGLYIVYQTTKNDAESDSILLSTQLVSFAEKDDCFIYGVYFNLICQEKICSSKLVCSEKPIKLSCDVQFVFDNYLEVYHNVLGTTVILGLASGINNLSASLQYSHNSKYFYEELGINGIKDPNYPKTCLIGLSKNLSNLVSCEK